MAGSLPLVSGNSRALCSSCGVGPDRHHTEPRTKRGTAFENRLVIGEVTRGVPSPPLVVLAMQPEATFLADQPRSQSQPRGNVSHCASQPRLLRTTSRHTLAVGPAPPILVTLTTVDFLRYRGGKLRTGTRATRLAPVFSCSSSSSSWARPSSRSSRCGTPPRAEVSRRSPRVA